MTLLTNYSYAIYQHVPSLTLKFVKSDLEHDEQP